MKTGTTTHYTLCRFKNRPDARCRKLPRCKTCNRVLAFNWQTGLCFACEQKAKAKAAAAAPSTSRSSKPCSPTPFASAVKVTGGANACDS